MSTIATTNLKHPSSAVNNMVLSSNGNVTATTKFIGSGLDHIVTQSFTSASSVSLNNCFSSSYENYKIIFTLSSISAAAGINMRMRAAGVDTSTSTYNWTNGRTGRVSTTDAGGFTGQTSFQLMYATNGYEAGMHVEIMRPYVSGGAKYVGLGQAYDGGYLLYSESGSCTQATQHDGFTLYPTTGNMTGTIRLYGYENT